MFLDLNLTFNLVASSLSAISTSIMILVFVIERELRQVFAFRLIYYLTCSDFVGSLLTLSQTLFLIFLNEDMQAYKEYCEAIGMLKIFFFLMSFLWTSSLCFCLVQTLVNDKKNIDKYERCFFLIAFFIPLIASIIPLIFQSYKLVAQEELCWINNPESPTKNNVLRIVCFFGILWVLVIYNIYSITRVGIFVRDHSPDLPYLNRWKVFYFYPIIMIFCWFWPSAKQISDWITIDNERIPVIISLTHLLTPLSGLFNLLTFIGTNNYLRQRFMAYCCICCCSKKEKPEVQSNDQKNINNLSLQKSLLPDMQNTGDLNYSANRFNSISQHLFSESV